MDQAVLTAIDLSVLHDAELSVVATDREQTTLRLGFRAVDRRIHTLSFDGVMTFRIESMIYQNVVSRVLLSGSNIDSDSELEQLTRWTSSSDSGLLQTEHAFQRNLAKVRTGELRLLYVEPSWGAEIGVLAQRFALAAD